MEFGLSDEQKILIRSVRDFIKGWLTPLEEEVETTGRLNPEKARAIFKKSKELGFYAMNIPEEYGGGGAGYDGYVLSMEQIGKVCGGVAMTISGHCMTLSTIMAFGTEEQKKKYMIPGCTGEQILSVAFTEPGTGSDPKQLTTTAIKDGDKYKFFY